MQYHLQDTEDLYTLLIIKATAIQSQFTIHTKQLTYYITKVFDNINIQYQVNQEDSQFQYSIIVNSQLQKSDILMTIDICSNLTIFQQLCQLNELSQLQIDFIQQLYDLKLIKQKDDLLLIYFGFQINEIENEIISQSLEKEYDFIFLKNHLIKLITESEQLNIQFIEYRGWFDQNYFYPNQSEIFSAIKKIIADNGNKQKSISINLLIQCFIVKGIQKIIDNINNLHQFITLNQETLLFLDNSHQFQVLFQEKNGLVMIQEYIINYIIFQNINNVFENSNTFNLFECLQIFFVDNLIVQLFDIIQQFQENDKVILPPQLQFTTIMQQLKQLKNAEYSTQFIFHNIAQLLQINQIFYKEIYEELIFRFNCTTVHQLNTILSNCSKLTQSIYLINFLQQESQLKLIKQFYVSLQDILQTQQHFKLLIQNNIESQVHEALTYIVSEIIVDLFRQKHLKEYQELILEVNQLTNIKQLINEEDYTPILNSTQFNDLKQQLFNFFENNVYSIELQHLLQKNIIGQDKKIAERFYYKLNPQFTVQETINLHLNGQFYQLLILKNNIAIQSLIKMLAMIISELFLLDQQDQLMQGIVKLKNEDLQLLQEQQQIEQNEFLEKSISQEKVSQIMQLELVSLLENNNFILFTQYIMQNYKQNSMFILQSLNKQINSYSQLLCKTEKHINVLYSKDAVQYNNQNDNQNNYFGLPLFLYANNQFQLTDNKNYDSSSITNKLHKQHYGFIQFLIDICETAQFDSQQALLSQEQIKQLLDNIKSRSGQQFNLENNINQSIKQNIYNNEELAFFIGTLIINQNCNIAPYYLNINTQKDININQLFEKLQNMFSKNKKQLLKFMQSPSHMTHYYVREHLLNKSVQPVVDVFVQQHSQIKDLIMNTALHLLLLDENSIFFQILLDYQQLKEYQVAGVSQDIGIAFHYDCLIKDYITGDAINFSIRKLSVASFRFYIVFYCSLIFLSSYVFNKYKGNSDYCQIISPFSVLQQDRFSYLISQISNGLNLICNVKGFTEKGAIGYINTILYCYIYNNYKSTQKVSTADLEDQIMKHDFDSVLTEYCRSYIQTQENQIQMQSKEKNDEKQEEEETIQIQQISEVYQNSNQNQINTNQLNDLSDEIKNQISTINNLRQKQDKTKTINQGTKIGIKQLFNSQQLQSLYNNQNLSYQFSSNNFDINYLQQIQGQQLVDYAQQDVQMADFIRLYCKQLPDIIILVNKSLILRDYIKYQYENKIYVFQADTQQLDYSVIQEFLKYYNLTRHQLLSIQNACNEQEFPEITEQVTIGQLVLFDNEKRDGQSRLSLIDEIIVSVIKVLNLTLINKNEATEMPINMQIMKLLKYFNNNFINYIQYYLDIGKIAQFIKNALKYKLTYKIQSISCKQIKIQGSQVYKQYQSNNMEFLQTFTDYDTTDDDYDELFMQLSNYKQQIMEFLPDYFDGSISVLNGILQQKFSQQQLNQHINQVFLDIYGENDGLEIFDHISFKQIIVVWSIVQE